MSIRIEIDAARVAFQVNEGELRALLTDVVVADLARRAVRVESEAKRNATGAPGPNVRSGRLRGSITWRPGRDGSGPYVDIGSSVVYAPYVELGTRHMAPRPYLRPALEAARG